MSRVHKVCMRFGGCTLFKVRFFWGLQGCYRDYIKILGNGRRQWKLPLMV